MDRALTERERRVRIESAPNDPLQVPYSPNLLEGNFCVLLRPTGVLGS